ncbi:MAG TPA: type II toxin-antitoxin system PemK/MazF family toxin [Acidobacteriota bacterium]
MRRGEVWWAELPEAVGRRPVVLLSRDSAYKVRSAATVAPITRTIRNIPVEVLLDQKDGLPSRCVVNADDIVTIPMSIIKGRIAVLSPQRMAQVEEAIRFALDLP